VRNELHLPAPKLVTPGDTGWPDRLVMIPGGSPHLAEFKRPDEEPRPKQAYIHRLLRKLGYDVGVYDDLDDFKEAILRRL